MIERWLLGLLGCALGLVCTLACRRRTPLHLGVILAGASAIVASFYPLVTTFVAPRTWRNVSHLDESAVVAAQGSYVLFLLGFTLSTLVVWARGGLRGGSAERAPRPEGYERWRDGWVSLGLLVMGGALYLSYVRSVGLDTLVSRHDFAEKYLASEGRGTTMIGLSLVVLACLWAEGGQVGRALRWLFRAVSAGVILWSVFFLGQRSYAVAIGLGHLFLFVLHRRIEVRAVRPRVVVMLLLAYAGLELFALVRGAWQGSFVDAVAVVQGASEHGERTLGELVGGSELAHPFITTMEVERYERGGELGGSSYLQAPLVVLPRSLYPARPDTLAKVFVERYYPSVAARGGGTAFSLVAEGWWNFGALGPLFLGLAVAALAHGLDRRGARDPGGVVARFAPYSVHLALLAHRSAAGTTFKQSITVLAPALALCLVAQVTWLAVRAKAPRRGATRLALET